MCVRGYVAPSKPDLSCHPQWLVPQRQKPTPSSPVPHPTKYIECCQYLRPREMLEMILVIS